MLNMRKHGVTCHTMVKVIQPKSHPHCNAIHSPHSVVMNLYIQILPQVKQKKLALQQQSKLWAPSGSASTSSNVTCTKGLYISYYTFGHLHKKYVLYTYQNLPNSSHTNLFLKIFHFHSQISCQYLLGFFYLTHFPFSWRIFFFRNIFLTQENQVCIL